MKRRDFLKTASVMTAGAAASGVSLQAMNTHSSPEDTTEYLTLTNLSKKIRPLAPELGGRKVTCAIIGAGGRGMTYSGVIQQIPSGVEVVAVSDLNEFRKNRIGDCHNIPQDKRFGDFHELLSQPKLADAVFICLPDYLHYEAAMKAMERGYDVLLEKPMAQSEKECRDLLAQSKKYNCIMGTCHVLRYTPYYIALREAAQSGMIGDILRIQHQEDVQRVHFSHSYVRGNWHNSKQTTPIILSKSCHDLDIIRWIMGKSYKSAMAQGKLTYFRSENAPEGAALRCTDCPLESKCSYSAIDIYLRRREWNHVIDKKTGTDEEIMEFLRKSDYGKCVFHCDNDQPDYYISDFTFEDGTTASFIMETITPTGERLTTIIGTKGYIEGNGDSFCVHDFLSRTKKTWLLNKDETAKKYLAYGHGGGDAGIVRDFVEAVAYHDPGKLSSTIDASMESHIVGFKCEKSRKTGKRVKV